MTNLLERLVSHMPRYHNRKDFKERGKVIITPRPWYRAFPILRNILPYHVGDQIRFNIHIDEPNIKQHLPHHILEKFGNNNWNQLPFDINRTDVEITGNIISAEGDVVYGIGYAEHFHEIPETIMTAKVNNWDTIIQNWAWMIISAIFGGVVTLIGGIILGLFEVVPERIVWWPW